MSNLEMWRCLRRALCAIAKGGCYRTIAQIFWTTRKIHLEMPINLTPFSGMITSPSVALPFPQTASYIYDSTHPPTAQAF
ncbi:hypothetical protein [Tolypothrix sp. VBCCA 56010]|uniref:hypothetical protein n=1 Tax=Tolypothrix sp. VBCCA 56010 TaxID=3137731 RepID=UPI003D7D4FE0